jgi:hypothetical protein
MLRRLVANIALLIFVLPSPGARASSIQLLNYEGGVQFSQSAPENSGFSIPQYLPMTLNYGPQGGSVTFDAGALTPPFSGLTANSNQVFPINGQFFLNLGVPSNGSNNSFAGPVIDISGTLTGTLTGPGAGGVTWRWSGGYSGTATSATLDPFNSQDTSQLPAPLLDILNHPDHLHFSVSVTGGEFNDLTATLTFDPPSPVTAPEPTTMITLAVGAATMIYRRRKSRVKA